MSRPTTPPEPASVLPKDEAPAVFLVQANAYRSDFSLIWAIMADGVGFEPTVSVNPRRFSRPVP